MTMIWPWALVLVGENKKVGGRNFQGSLRIDFDRLYGNLVGLTKNGLILTSHTFLKMGDLGEDIQVKNKELKPFFLQIEKS